MKKAVSMLLALSVLFALTACQSEPEPEVVEYVPNSMAEVAVCYIFDGKANIATRPLTDTPLKKITIACVYYDITGKQIGQLKMIDCTVGEQKNVTLWQTECPEMAVYIDSTVYSVEDQNGKKQTASGIRIWEKSVKDAFRVDTYLDSLVQKLSKNSVLALTNDYAITKAVSWHNDTLIVEMEILSETVTSVYLFTLWFDESGQPVKTDACNYCYNGESMAAHIDTPDNHNYMFTAPENAQSAKLIVQSVELNDGSQWINPYCYEWILLNHNSAK